MIEPDICTSLICSPPKEYCVKCPHAIFRGEVPYGNKTIQFEYNPRYGITFEKNIQVPKETDPVWDNIHAWITEHAWITKERGD